MGARHHSFIEVSPLRHAAALALLSDRKRSRCEMADLTSTLGPAGTAGIRKAVCRHSALSRAGLSERLFALLFSGLVYPQIWEDPDIDMEAMKLCESHRIVAIASGGCNVLTYLTRAPAAIDAVDLNPAHIALNRLKLAAVRHLPGQADLFRFFGANGHSGNEAAYHRFIAPHLDEATRAYWEKRDWRGRRRIARFAGNFNRTGLLGFCIWMGHAVARLHGVNPAQMMEARTRAEQRRFFEEELAPLFQKPLIRWAVSRKASLFGLGIPPAQYDALASEGETGMADVLAARLERLAHHFPLRDNYFAWQAFARRYPAPGEGALPGWLEASNYETVRKTVARVRIHHASITDLLAARPAASVDRFVLLDAQDWMNEEQLNMLWREITRTAAPDARVIFRTAGRASLLPGRVSPSLLSQWDYEAERSAEFTARDRSAIYGGFHLYGKRA
jgi:S-adenosylmethionine-diacylglycerol 3-amino-3-carboxypropyl transferase